MFTFKCFAFLPLVDVGMLRIEQFIPSFTPYKELSAPPDDETFEKIISKAREEWKVMIALVCLFLSFHLDEN